jgi:hypothetical protein
LLLVDSNEAKNVFNELKNSEIFSDVVNAFEEDKKKSDKLIKLLKLCQ